MSEQWSPQSTDTPAKVSNNMVLAIIAIVVSIVGCCIPHGIISLIFALQVDKKASAGDMTGAATSAKQAKMWAWISIIAGAIGLVIALVFGAFGAVLSILTSR
ncbi:MAG: CD225/dispanin family protein [Pyrinomonadaceae bacterium]